MAKSGKKRWKLLRAERTLRGHPQIAKQMMENLPGKTAKQIRDKRNYPSYKALVAELDIKQGQVISGASDSGDESDHRQHLPALCTTNTEDGDLTEQGRVNRQQGPVISVIGEYNPVHRLDRN
jgi:hypothetical protein